MDLNQGIHDIANKNYITYFGVADLSEASDVILDQGGSEIASFPYSISLGIALIKTIVDQLPNRAERSVAVNYEQHAYNIINQRLDLVASIISSYLQQEGYRVLPISVAERVDDERICGAFSHKLSAHLAGLGWIGKSCLLVTPKDGPRVRWTSVLTDAPLKPTGVRMEEQCGDCTECVDICPRKAFTGKSFKIHESREARYDARNCEKYFIEMKNKGQISVCGLCLYVCPYGRK